MRTPWAKPLLWAFHKGRGGPEVLLMGLRCGVIRVLRVSYALQETPGRFVAMDF
jgi:hypothetical protein